MKKVLIRDAYGMQIKSLIAYFSKNYGHVAVIEEHQPESKGDILFLSGQKAVYSKIINEVRVLNPDIKIILFSSAPMFLYQAKELYSGLESETINSHIFDMIKHGGASDEQKQEFKETEKFLDRLLL